MTKFFSLFIASLGCFCPSVFSQIDSEPPKITCKTDTQLDAAAWGGLMVFAQDLIDTISENATPANQIEIGIRKKCTGSGFPENKQTAFFNCQETSFVEIWARDLAGNTAFCETLIHVVDGFGTCDPLYRLLAETPDEIGVSGVKIEVFGENCTNDTLRFNRITKEHGTFSAWGNIAPSGGFAFEATAKKDTNFLNGVTSLDLLAIQKHILGAEPFTSPYQFLAADANQDGKITTFDVLVLRKLILGITTDLPNHKSWRFVPKDFSFPPGTDPLQIPFPEKISMPPTELIPTRFEFVGVKIGDVNFSADPKL